MSKSSLLAQILCDKSGAFIFEKGVCVLTYEQLRELLEAHDGNFKAKDYLILKWTRSNTKEFIIDYLSAVYNRTCAVLVEEGRLDKAEYDFSQLSYKLQCDTVIYTSGSTAAPKGVRLGLENFIASAQATIKHYEINASDNWALSLPLYHIGGIMIVWRALIAGASVTLASPATIIEDIMHNPQITMASLVQLQLERSLESGSDVVTRFSELKAIILGGSKIGRPILERAIASNYQLSTSYGATETCAQFLATPITDNIDILTTSGKPMAGRIKQVDGVAVLEGDSVARGYLSAQDFNGSFKTSDQFIKDDRGNITILGRRDFVFQKAAENINPQLIEDKISSLTDKGHYTLPIKDEKYENLIALIYQGDASLKEAQNLCAQKLTSFERPHLIYKAHSLAPFFKGIKIQRNLLATVLNDIHLNFSHHFKVSAQGNPKGDIIIVGHGFMGEALDLGFLSELSRDYLLLYIDLPGHGLNKKVCDLGLFENAIHALLKELEEKEKKIHFITYSMSARIYQQILRDAKLKNYKCFGKFINESGAPGFILDEEQRMKRLAHDTKLLSNTNEAQEFFGSWYAQSVFNGIKDCEGYTAMFEKKCLEYPEYVQSWNTISPIISVAKQDDLRDLSQLPKSLEFYYLYGDADEKYATYKDAYFGKKFTARKISKASHNTHFMNPSEYLSAIKEILNS